MAFGIFQFRRGTAAEWSAANTVLRSGELGLETDTDKFKIGDGLIGWNALPYGGIKGDTGATGAPGVSPTVTVGATTVVTPATNPSATDADAGPNADIRFSLPRARAVTAGTTATGAAGTSAAVQSAVNGDGDVTLNFTIPRGDTGAQGPQGIQGPQGATGNNGWSPILANVADGERRVLRLVDWTGGTGTKPAVPTDNYIGPAGFTNLAGATDIRGATGATGATGPTGPAAQAFTSIAVTGQNTVVAEQANDTLTLVGAGTVTITTDALNDTVTIAGAAAAPQNTFANVSVGTTPAPTVLSADAAADTLSINAGPGISLTADAGSDALTINNAGVTRVNGQAGEVTIPVNPAVTRSTPTASASTALTTIQSFSLTGGATQAGHEYKFEASLRVINTTTATNLVITLSVGATNVLVLTQAIGTTAAAAPGAPVIIRGSITFSSATAAEANIEVLKQQAVAFTAVANTSAPVTVATAANTTIDLKVNTSGATSTFIARQALIRKVA